MNLQAVDLNLLLAMEALLEERNVSRAARRLGLSQPAMSNALARLRGLLNDPLFVRAPGGVAPTPRAERMAPGVRAGLEQFRRALDGVREFDPSSSSRTFRIALSDHAEWLLAPHLLRAVEREAPGVRVQCKRLDALFVLPEAELRMGAADIAIGFFPDARTADESTRLETVAEEEHVVVMRRGHPLSRRTLTIEDYAAAPHAAVIYRPEPWGLIDQELAARGLRRNLRLASPHFLTVLHTA
ncbi:MAG TPA: LysR family transcriptional regulator, partial [Solibacterales bacterium]|nr:LysR family transcriptional regulator [Bryobacterales bacterium]